MPDSTVTVKSLHYFRGQEGEGEGGMVKPGDTLTVDKRRAAELRANGLVEKASGDEAEAAKAEVGKPAIAQPDASKPAAPAPAKAVTLTTETVTSKPAVQAAPAAPAEAKK
jgi:hypothetical protein